MRVRKYWAPLLAALICFLTLGAHLFLIMPEIRWAIRDGIIHAALQIDPGIVLMAMTVIALLAGFILPLILLAALEHLPGAKKRRAREDVAAISRDRDSWRSKYFEELAERRRLEIENEKQARIIALEANTNTEFNRQAKGIGG